MRKFFTWLKVIAKVLPSLLHYYFSVVLKQIKHKEKYSINLRYQNFRLMVIKILNAFNVKIIVEGKNYLNELGEKGLYLANHVGGIDPLVLVAISEKPITFAAKKELGNKIVIREIKQLLDLILLDRENVMNQIHEIKTMVNTIKDPKGFNLGIFPEGTRNKQLDDKCLEFKAGSVKVGYMAKAKIVPITIWGTFRVLSKKHYLKEYPIFVKFDEPIGPNDYSNISSAELAENIRQQISKNLIAIKEQDKLFITNQKIGKKRIEYETSYKY